VTLKQPAGEYRGFRARGIRLNEDMLPELGRLSAGRTRPMLRAVHAFDKAHAVMLCEEGLLARPHAAAILRALRRMEAEGVEEARTRVGGGVHSGEQYLIRALGEDVGGRLHLARSTGDLTSVGINVLQRESLLAAMEAINRLRPVLVRLAREHTDTIMPGYSFGQHAQPMTLAHLWLSWAATLARDFDRLRGAFRRVNVSPAGAVIMVGSDFPRPSCWASRPSTTTPPTRSSS
jgi:argininosuccinate lyase